MKELKKTFKEQKVTSEDSIQTSETKESFTKDEVGASEESKVEEKSELGVLKEAITLKEEIIKIEEPSNRDMGSIEVIEVEVEDEVDEKVDVTLDVNVDVHEKIEASMEEKEEQVEIVDKSIVVEIENENENENENEIEIGTKIETAQLPQINSVAEKTEDEINEEIEIHRIMGLTDEKQIMEELCKLNKVNAKKAPKKVLAEEVDRYEGRAMKNSAVKQARLDLLRNSICSREEHLLHKTATPVRGNRVAQLDSTRKDIIEGEERRKSRAAIAAFVAASEKENEKKIQREIEELAVAAEAAKKAEAEKDLEKGRREGLNDEQKEELERFRKEETLSVDDSDDVDEEGGREKVEESALEGADEEKEIIEDEEIQDLEAVAEVGMNKYNMLEEEESGQNGEGCGQEESDVEVRKEEEEVTEVIEESIEDEKEGEKGEAGEGEEKEKVFNFENEVNVGGGIEERKEVDETEEVHEERETEVVEEEHVDVKEGGKGEEEEEGEEKEK